MKRIIVCADGTWNETDRVSRQTGRPQPTNVLKVARGVLARSSTGVDQVVYYHKGVGTLGGLDQWTGGAFGSGMETNVREIYRFLAYNYEAGDELYFFGFSRGAFTVRTLIGFMSQIGLLAKDDEYYTGTMYGLYESNIPVGSNAWNTAFQHISEHRPCPPIRFIGVWDTVGALGAPGALGQLLNRNKFKYHDIGLHACVQNAFQALAIDERRKSFAPSLWIRPSDWSGVLEQAWFAGVHSNVGGSYSPDGLANEALQWMAEKAEGLGLEFHQSYLSHYRPCFNSVLNDSMTLIYKTMGSHVRPIGLNPDDGEKVHQSAVDRMNYAPCKYAPENLQAGIAASNLPTVNTARIPRGTPC